jgi:hypothetical protein
MSEAIKEGCDIHNVSMKGLKAEFDDKRSLVVGHYKGEYHVSFCNLNNVDHELIEFRLSEEAASALVEAIVRIQQEKEEW